MYNSYLNLLYHVYCNMYRDLFVIHIITLAKGGHTINGDSVGRRYMDARLIYLHISIQL